MNSSVDTARRLPHLLSTGGFNVKSRIEEFEFQWKLRRVLRLKSIFAERPIQTKHNKIGRISWMEVEWSQFVTERGEKSHGVCMATDSLCHETQASKKRELEVNVDGIKTIRKSQLNFLFLHIAAVRCCVFSPLHCVSLATLATISHTHHILIECTRENFEESKNNYGASAATPLTHATRAV